MNTKVLAADAILLLSTSAAMAQARPRAGGPTSLQACKPDIARFCSQVPPGQAGSKPASRSISPSFPSLARKGSFRPG
jgi:hypothetical protein